MQIIYKKVLREIGCYKARTILTLSGIIIGVFSIGFILSAYGILQREMDRNYRNTNPASIVLKISNLDQEAIHYLNQVSPELKIEARKCLQGRINRRNGTYGTIYLYGIKDFNNLSVDTFSLEKGRFPEEPLQMALEKDSLTLLPNVKKGYDEEVFIQLPGEKEQKIQISGKVHAPGLSPASMEKYSYGFMSLEGLQELGYKGWYDELHIICEPQRFNRSELKAMASQLQEKLIQKGYHVEEVNVPEPGKHPHNDQLQSFLFLLEVFTIIALLIACMIVASLINAIMNTQKKQMAIMKTTGATTWTIAKAYFLYVLLMSIIAEIIGLPLAYLVGRKYAEVAAATLNFKIASYAIPGWMTSLQIVIGISVPLLVSFYVINKNARTTVKEGLSNQDDRKNNKGIFMGYKKREKIGICNKVNLIPWIKMPLGNMLRKKGRTLLVIMALASGGIIFLAAQNIAASITQTVDKSKDSFDYNYDIKLQGMHLEDELRMALKRIPEVKSFQIYGSNRATLIDGERQTATYRVKALPSGAETLRSIGYEKKGIKNGILVNQGLINEETGLEVGQEVHMKVGEKIAEVTIIGVVNEVPPIPCMYIALEDYERLFGNIGEQNLLIYLEQEEVLTSQKQLEITATIEEEFKKSNISIAENWNIYLLREAFRDHLKVIINFLSIVAILAIGVAGISLVSIVGMNVSERKRELGVLQAIGSSKGKFMQMILIEVMGMGSMGWLVGAFIAYPISVLAGNYFGQIFMHTYLQNTVSFSGVVLWLGLAVGTCIVSGIIAANQVLQLPLRDLLDYE